MAQTGTETLLYANPNQLKQLVQITVDVYPGNCDLPPAGDVTILANSVAIASLPLRSGSANLSVSTVGVPAGSYLLTAIYTGTATDESSSSYVNVNILNEPTLSFEISPNPVEQGTATFLTLKVSGMAGTPTGTAIFDYGINELGTAVLDDTGTAQIPLATASLSPGSYSLVANYAGDDNYNEAESTLTLIVQ
jgi:hypothetical protein